MVVLSWLIRQFFFIHAPLSLLKNYLMNRYIVLIFLLIVFSSKGLVSVVEGIEVGEKLSLPNEEHTEPSFFSWQMLLVFLEV